MANKVSEQLKKEIKEEQANIKVSYFWGRLIAIISLVNGAHILYFSEVLTERLDAYFLMINEDIFGILLVLFAVIKLIGIISENFQMRAVGIIGLSILWGMLTIVAVMFSLGIGYPDNAYLSNLMMLVACLRVSYKGASRR